MTHYDHEALRKALVTITKEEGSVCKLAEVTYRNRLLWIARARTIFSTLDPTLTKGKSLKAGYSKNTGVTLQVVRQ